MPRSPRNVGLAVLISVFSAHALEPAEGRRLNLKEFMQLAETQGGQLGEARAKILYSEAREDEARAKAWPSGNLDIGVGPSPGATGDALNGRMDWSKFTVVTVANVELAIPLYTWGALSSGRKAAEAGTRAEKLLYERDRWTLRSEVAKLYYGYQLAFELSEIAADVTSKLSKAIDEGRKIRARGGKGAPSEADLNKLKVVLSEAKVGETVAAKGMEQARLGMAWKIGTYGVTSPRWDQANLVKRKYDLKTLQDYQVVAYKHRPEVKALKEDVNAKDGLLGVEEGLRLPTFFLAGRGQYSYSPGWQDQHSPFAYDPLNSISGGVFVGLRWDVNFFEHSAKVGKARAELLAAQARLRHFEAGIYAEVEKNYLDSRQAERALELRSEASESAKRLFRDAVADFALGTGTARNLLEALGTYVSSEKSRLEAINDYNVSLTALEGVVGQELL